MCSTEMDITIIQRGQPRHKQMDVYNAQLTAKQTHACVVTNVGRRPRSRML